MVLENSTNSAGGKIKKWLPGAMVVLLVGLSLGGCTNELQKQNAQIIKQNQQLSRQLTIQGKELKQLQVELQQQTAVTYAALGKVIPVKMPVEFDRQLADAEVRAIGLAIAHPDKEAATSLIEEISKIADELPPWAEQNYLPRFNTLRWLAASEYLLADAVVGPGKTANAADAWASRLERLSRAKPISATAHISQLTLNAVSVMLANESKRLRAWAEWRRFRSAELAAVACINQPNPRIAAEEIRNLSLWALRGDGASAKARSKMAHELIRKLRPLAADWEASLLVTRLDQLMKSGRGLPDSVRAAGASQIFSQAIAIRVGLALRGIHAGAILTKCQAKCKSALAEIAARESMKQKSIERAYQVWALKRIEKCAKVYAANAKMFSGSYKAMLNSAVKELLPIKQTYLRPAVESEYSLVYNKVWNELDVKDYQLQLAKDAVSIKRFSPIEVWKQENQNGN
jgi:hypothetical protein